MCMLFRPWNGAAGRLADWVVRERWRRDFRWSRLLRNVPSGFGPLRSATWKSRLSGGLSALRLEPVQKIDGALGVGSGLEDRAVIVLENL
jgi:hypothetical protein